MGSTAIATVIKIANRFRRNDIYPGGNIPAAAARSVSDDLRGARPEISVDARKPWRSRSRRCAISSSSDILVVFFATSCCRIALRR